MNDITDVWSGGVVRGRSLSAPMQTAVTLSHFFEQPALGLKLFVWPEG